MRASEEGEHTLAQCSVAQVFALIGGKWKIAILCKLGERPYRFGELRRALAEVSHKVLTQHLRQLEHDGLVTRTTVLGNPPGVEYRQSALAESLRPVLLKLDNWGRQHLPS